VTEGLCALAGEARHAPGDASAYQNDEQAGPGAFTCLLRTEFEILRNTRELCVLGLHMPREPATISSFRAWAVS
jgi:hypothetical protein